MPTYILSGYVSVLLNVRKNLKDAIAAISAETGVIQRDLYNKAIEDFIHMHAAFDRRLASQSRKAPNERRRPRPITYTPLYVGKDGVALRMWVRKDVMSTVMKLAEHLGIGRRILIYTALCNAFHTDKEITECHQNQPP